MDGGVIKLLILYFAQLFNFELKSITYVNETWNEKIKVNRLCYFYRNCIRIETENLTENKILFYKFLNSMVYMLYNDVNNNINGTTESFEILKFTFSDYSRPLTNWNTGTYNNSQVNTNFSIYYVNYFTHETNNMSVNARLILIIIILLIKILKHVCTVYFIFRIYFAYIRFFNVYLSFFV